MNLEEEFFIRELTRKLDEQINSIRRELDNLKKMGLLKSKTKNRKKYYVVNKDFLFLDELKGIFIKALSSNEELVEDLKKMGHIKVLVLSGLFVNDDESNVDMLIVGDVDREKLNVYINQELRTKRPVKFAIMTEEDYQYRLQCNDKFVTEIMNSESNQIAINKK